MVITKGKSWQWIQNHQIVILKHKQNIAGIFFYIIVKNEWSAEGEIIDFHYHIINK